MQPKGVRYPQSRRRKISVRLVGFSPIARERLVQLLSRSRAIRVVSSRGSGLARRPEKGLVLLLSLYSLRPEPGALAACVGSLRQQFPEARILLVGPRLPAGRIIPLLGEGVRGFVDGEHAREELIGAIRAVWNGQLWLAGDVLLPGANSDSAPRDRADGGDGVLTPRQARVAELAGSGLANKQIASELGISERTVKFHIQNIFARLGIHGRHMIPDALRATTSYALGDGIFVEAVTNGITEFVTNWTLNYEAATPDEHNQGGTYSFTMTLGWNGGGSTTHGVSGVADCPN